MVSDTIGNLYMTTLFISDLHLHSTRPETSKLFLNFLNTKAKTANALYILGDFFEAWIGEDNYNIHDNTIIQGLTEFSKTGIPLFFMQGNRDFLINHIFAKKIKCTLLPDPYLLEIEGQRILLMHGDLLCTKDIGYQWFRKFVRHPIIKRVFLNLPLFLRRKIAGTLRMTSSRPKQKDLKKPNEPLKSPLKNSSHEKYDVTQQAVHHYLQTYQADCLIHGHTHREGIHQFELNGVSKKRFVLGDWEETGSVLVFNKNTIYLEKVVCTTT